MRLWAEDVLLKLALTPRFPEQALVVCRYTLICQERGGHVSKVCPQLGQSLAMTDGAILVARSFLENEIGLPLSGGRVLVVLLA